MSPKVDPDYVEGLMGACLELHCAPATDMSPGTSKDHDFVDSEVAVLDKDLALFNADRPLLRYSTEAA